MNTIQPLIKSTIQESDRSIQHIIVTQNAMCVTSDTQSLIEIEQLRIMTPMLLNMIKKLNNGLDQHASKEIMIDSDQGTLLIQPVNADTTIIATLYPEANIGMARIYIKGIYDAVLSL